jgi:uncharacterized cupin superfamily protein
MDPLNVFDAVMPPQADDSRPEGFRRHHLQIGPLVGASRIGATLYELPPGQRICPYHYEYNNEEWLVVTEGRPTLRTPSGERELHPGDVVAFPEGPAGAHGVSNGTNVRVRVVLLSTKRKPAVAVYPDSDKLAIWRIEGGEADEMIVKRSGGVGYWEGEPVGPPSPDIAKPS